MNCLGSAETTPLIRYLLHSPTRPDCLDDYVRSRLCIQRTIPSFDLERGVSVMYVVGCHTPSLCPQEDCQVLVTGIVRG